MLQARVALFQVAGINGRWKIDTAFAIDLVQWLHSAMDDDGADALIQAVKDALRLAEGVAEQHRGSPGRGVGAPPVIDVAEYLGLGRPFVDRQTEGRFGNEGVAAHRLERGAGAVRLDLVVA